MKKISIVLLSILIGLFIFSGCSVSETKQTAESENTKENEPSKEKSTILTPVESETIVDSTQEIVYGGNSEFLEKYRLEYYGVDTFISNIVGEDKVAKWLEQFESLQNPNGRAKTEINKFTVVKELNVPKEEFIKANKGLGYTDEQIEAIYSGDQKLVNRAFVNDYALLVNDEIYTPDWLALHTIKDYEKAGITVEVLLEYLNKINFSTLDDEYLSIKGVLKKSNKIDTLNQSKLELSAPYQLEYYGLDSFLYDIIDNERLNEWAKQFQLEYTRDRRDTSGANIINVVKELNVPKEDFIKANNGLVYTEEQIEAIYSGDKKLINKVFTNDYALMVNDKIYTVDWLFIRRIDDYQKAGITKDILEQYLKKINIPEFKVEYNKINGLFEAMH